MNDVLWAIKGTVDVQIELVKKSSNDVKLFGGPPRLKDGYDGFGTELRPYYADNGMTHGMKNFVVDDDLWEPNGVLASISFTILASCDEDPVLKSPPTLIGDWSLNKHGWKRARGHNLPPRSEGTPIKVKK